MEKNHAKIKLINMITKFREKFLAEINILNLKFYYSYNKLFFIILNNGIIPFCIAITIRQLRTSIASEETLSREAIQAYTICCFVATRCNTGK